MKFKSVAFRRVFPRSLLALAVAAAAPASLAGKIIADTYGQGGWNQDNVTIFIDGNAYWADVSDGTDGTTIVMGKVLAKDWPLGEAPGIKVVHDDYEVKNGKPVNCIMATTYQEGYELDTPEPRQLSCSGPYQSHKRFKVAMLPTTADGGDSDSVDLVFNVEADEGVRDYQVFQKINNWTDSRLGGFRIQVGRGVGKGFEPITETGIVSLKVPAKVGEQGLWSFDQLATFSAGLFGAEDTHGQVGYFDNKDRAGFHIEEFGTEAGETGSSQLTAIEPLKSDYAEVPVGAINQFGAWLPSGMLPTGIFYDDDGNPNTDAALVAWYGWSPRLGGTGWMRGVANQFEPVSDEEILAYGESLLYTTDEIDDLVNVGLNYIVSVGDVSSLTEFTIRVTPQPVETTPPPYYGSTPMPAVTFASSDGKVSIEPGPVFEQGSLLTVRVGDADLSEAAPVLVDIESSDLGVSGITLELVEQGPDRGVYAASLPDAFSNIGLGKTVTVTYHDEDIGDGAEVFKSVQTTAVEYVPPVLSDGSITSFSAPDQLFDGQERTLMISLENDNKAGDALNGSVELEANGQAVWVFEDLVIDPGKKLKLTHRWTAVLEDPEVAETLEWTARLIVPVETSADSTVEIPVSAASAITEVLVKVGKNKK